MLHHSNETLSRLSFIEGPTGERAADELRRRDVGLTGLVHPVRVREPFRACAACAMDEVACTCAYQDIQNYYGAQVEEWSARLRSAPIAQTQRKEALKLGTPLRPTGQPAVITIRVTNPGWIIEAAHPDSLPFRMGLRYGPYTRERVATLLKKIAATYPRGTRVPEVPEALGERLDREHQ